MDCGVLEQELEQELVLVLVSELVELEPVELELVELELEPEYQELA